MRQGKRIVSAWLLLSVFTSMILLSGLHHHEEMTGAAIDCADCTHHVHHSGHLTVDTNHMDDCVLCQFISLVYTAAAILLVAILFSPTIQVIPSNVNFISRKIDQYKSTRAPPFIL
ncbi:MAG: hypothetical protein J6W43_00580 [Prevotella sp.]|nr:hypothetical protein [Prevotella sp.]